MRHHCLIEKRFAEVLGIKSDDILSVAIDKDTHKAKEHKGTVLPSWCEWTREPSPRLYQTTPSEITLGHELIHVFRYMRGELVDIGVEANYSYISKDGIFGKRGKNKIARCRVEELQTVGIPYRHSKPSTYKYTENTLRKEHGYGKRIRY